MTLLNPWLWWLIAAIIFVIMEIFTPGFVIIFFGFGALAASIVAGCGASVNWQIGAFIVFSAAAFALIRPFAQKYLKRKGGDVPMNADAIINRKVVVTEQINDAAHTGRVAIDGDSWKAKSDDGSIIEPSEQVIVLSREGLIVTVKRAE